MAGIGTLINVTAIVVGTTIGLLIKGGLPQRFQDIIMTAAGLVTTFIGLSGALAGLLSVDGTGLATQNTMLIIGALFIGALIGEGINIERRLEGVGEWCRARIPSDNKGSSTFVEGFVTSSLLFCVGAMAIVGSLEDGLNHNFSTLFAKSMIDGVVAVVYAATLGIGVYLSALAVLVYQGSITLLAGIVRPYLSDGVISQMSCVGSILIFALGINMLLNKKLKIGNLLPAMFIPLFYQLIMSLLGIL